jgi:hypothetical protein
MDVNQLKEKRLECLLYVVDAMNGVISTNKAKHKILTIFKRYESKLGLVEKDLEGNYRVDKLIKLDGERCFYCNKLTKRVETGAPGACSEDSLTIDHVIPKKQGGLNHIINCIVCCYECNNSKGSSCLLPPKLFNHPFYKPIK